MKALVTGATGLLGSHLVDRLLERGHEVRALLRRGSDTSYLEERGVELAYGDLSDPDSLRAAAEGRDVVYHAAALVSDWGPWREFRRVTIRGTANALEAAAAAGVPRFLHVSTDAVYSHRHLYGGRKVTEETPLETRFFWWDYYRRSKLAAERIAWRYHREGRIAASAVRPGVLLGERDRTMVPGFVQFLRQGWPRAFIGRGDNRVPYVYAGDVAEACILAATAEAGIGQAYNVVSPEVVTQRDILTAVAEALGLEPPRGSIPYPLAHGFAFLAELIGKVRGQQQRPTLTRFAVAMIAQDYNEDASKARRELGWEAKVPMREAVRRSIDWLREKRPQLSGG